MNQKPALFSSPAPQPVDLAGESVAGEEDPGASIDMAVAEAQAGEPPASENIPMSPGDEAPTGTPGTGEGVCRTCGGTGRLNGSACPDCNGTGKVNVGIGGA